MLGSALQNKLCVTFPKIQEKELSFAFPVESVTIMDWTVSDETLRKLQFSVHIIKVTAALLRQLWWFSAFLMLQAFNAVPHVW